jgi:cobalt-zinc-cadmium efflux system outer membrane protein
MRTWVVLLGAAALTIPSHAAAQRPVTRREAIEAALAAGPRVSLAAPDTAVARGDVLAARAYPNPVAAASYSKDSPQRHVSLDLPLDFPWLRGPRIGAAEAVRTASRLRFAFERAGARFEAEAGYTNALSAAVQARLSQHNAQDADSLVTLARLRREAGDASDLDVDLAVVNAGQLANTALDDSLAAVAALVELQRIMGLPSDSVSISLADTLALPAGAERSAGDSVTLQVAAAQADLRAAQKALALERGNIFGAASLEIGFERQAPVTDEPGMLPVVGIALPLPLFNRNGGAIAAAGGARDRAARQLEVTRRENAAAIAQASRELTAALARAERDRVLVASADRVAAMSLTAYAEGAAALPSVLEAARHAREVRTQFVNDVATAVIAEAALRWLTVRPAP